MSALWGEVSEVIDLDGLFPRVISRETGIGEIIYSIKATRSMKINPWIYHPRSAATITKNNSDYQFLSKEGIQKPSISEVKILGSFPINFNANWSIIGNSVPPLLMKAIATQIRYKLWQGDPLTRYPKTLTYPEILEAAWQDHLAPRDPDAPTVISTFAGGGGSSLGYSMAGYRELLAVEWDDHAVETFKLNFPDVPIYHGDIAKLTVEECMKLAGLRGEGELDLLDGSPPCQGVSTAGKRDLNDPRNQLFREFVRLLRGLKPKVFMMENVPGLVKGKMKLIFAEIMRELKASGYQVRCKKLNAMYFYVPQSRERLIFIGVRDDLGIRVSYPKVESRPIVVKDALVGITTTNNLTPIQKSWWDKLKPGQLGSAVHPKGHWFAFLKLSPLQICPTIKKSLGAEKFCYWDKPAGLSIEGYKRIGSFPDAFKFRGGYGKEKNRIGNSVPPLMMRSIAAYIKGTVLRQNNNSENRYY